MVESFGTRLARKIEASSPLCVGLDPSASLLASWGLADSPAGVEALCEAVLGAVSEIVAAVKPQVAYFERHGSKGIAVLERLMERARQVGLLVIADAKRGDIDATMTAYGEAWLRDGSPLVADALTVTAYLGLDAMRDLFDLARRGGKGIFAVVASSNPEGRLLQEARTQEGKSVEALLLGQLASLNAVHGGELGPFGAVVGATRTAGTLDLSSLNGPYLVPGVGAQGATPADVAQIFSGVGAHSVLVNASRSLLALGPDSASIEEGARRLADDLRDALSGAA